jgi:hypothetical protein
MSDWTEIKSQIQKETNKAFPKSNAESIIDYFLKIVEYSELFTIERGLETRFVEKNFDKFKEALKDISDVEGYLKSLYKILTPNNIPSGTLGSCFNRLFDEKFSHLPQIEKGNFFTTAQNPEPKQDPNYFSTKLPFGTETKILYDLRNFIEHKKDEIPYPSFTKSLIDPDTKRKDIQDCIVAYLNITELYLPEIKEKFDSLTAEKEPDFKIYLESVKENFKSRIGRFVHIKGQEDIRLSQGFVIEKISEEESERIERKGTVNDLRRNHVSEKRMLIWGDAGMGKSTTLEYLAYSDAEEKLRVSHNKLPIYVPLGLLTDKNVSLKASIFNKIGVDNSTGERMLKEGKINLFLDAINEIPRDDNNQLKTLRQREIQNLLSDYKNTFIIISNRPQDENIFSGVPVFQLQKMDREQIELFLKKNTEGKTQIAKLILDEIEKDNRLEKIVKTPLMLSRLIEIVKAKGEIPKSEGEIIEKFIFSLYQREQEEKKDANFDTKKIHRILRYLGYESLEKKDTNSGMPEDEVLNFFVRCKEKYGFSIDTVYVIDIATQLGILEKRDAMYTFAHQAYQDFYHAQEEKAILGI